MTLVAVVTFLFGYLMFNLGGSVEPGSAYESASSSATGALTLRSVDPLTVVGSRFKPQELVTVTGPGRTKRVEASSTGRFVVRFGSPSCNGFTIVARGSRGSRASLNFSQFVC